MSETKWTPRKAIVQALIVLQADNLRALTTGEGRGNLTPDMAAILDRELGFSYLYEALVLARQFVKGDSPQYAVFAAIDAALAKARGEGRRPL